MSGVIAQALRGWVTDLRWPPLRYWVALVLLSVEVVFLEKASSITAGGIAGLSLPIAHWLSVPVALVILAIKCLILLVVLRWGGRNLALWTAVASVFSSALMWLLELVPWQPQWTPWTAMPVLLLTSGSSISLLWNAGYSSGGYAALAQLLRVKQGVPVSATMFTLNLLGLCLMYLAFGVLSGTLSVIMCLLHGPLSGVWLRIWGRLLPPVPGAVPAGSGKAGGTGP